MDPIYDFKPVNTEMLVMSRLAFSLKKNRILKLMRNIANRNYEIMQKYAQFNRDEF